MPLLRFSILSEDFFIDDTPLKGKYKAVDNGNNDTIYEVDDIGLKTELELLQRYGLIRLIKSDRKEIGGKNDIVRLTEAVEIVEGGNIYLKVKILNREFIFTEGQLMSSLSLKRYMLRLGKFISVSGKDWGEIVQYWLDTGKKVHEVSDEDILREKVMNYLKKCVIYTKIEKTLGLHSLFFDQSEPSTVFCSIDTLAEYLQVENRRKLRSVLSEYIFEQSVQKYVYSEKKRFWRFLIDTCEVNLEEQMYEEEEEDD